MESGKPSRSARNVATSVDDGRAATIEHVSSFPLVVTQSQQAGALNYPHRPLLPEWLGQEYLADCARSRLARIVGSSRQPQLTHRYPSDRIRLFS